MQGIVDQILEGKYDYENSSLDFSCAKVELTMHKGEVCEGSFHVYSADDTFTHGFVSTTDMRMECLTLEFTGAREEIYYRFHGENLEEGDVVKGNFCIVSNQGEYYVPFVVSVAYLTPESSVGNIKNLFHFANLAKSNWQEAVGLFYSPEFVKVFEGSDSQFYDCYRGLSVYPGNEQNVEEFLIRINKKQKTGFVVREDTLWMELESMPYDVIETELNIKRNGWGYTALHVECEGEFVFTQKEFLGDEDFTDNHCRVPVFIDTQLCRQGLNHGRIYLYNSHVSIEIPVTVQMGEEAGGQEERLKRKREIVQLMASYQDFRMKKIGSAAWLEETGEIVEAMVARNEDDVEARLFQAQLLISEERYNEAEWVLEHAVDMLEQMDEEHNTLYAYYLYLTTLIQRDEDYVNQVTARVEKLYGRDRSDWRIAWLLLYLSEEYNKTATTKWEFLEKQFARGCESPILYIEALHLLNGNPSLLRKLDSDTLQILNYGSKQVVLSPELAEQVLYLAGRSKDYSPVLLKVLQRIYGKQQDVRFLQEICTMLVRGSCVGPSYFEWYEAGVKAQLRITNLYEYYMMSVDMQKVVEIPRIVLMYFSYQANLDLTHSAFLYWYVVQHKLELGELYETYKPRMEYFVVDQIQKGRINRHLAGLYQELLVPAMVNEHTAGQLAKLLFAHSVCVEDLRLRKVIVYQPGNLREMVYPLVDGKAWIPLYGNDCTILFEDAYNNRFVTSVEYTLEKLMIPGKFLRMIFGYVTDCVELDIYRSEYGQNSELLSEEAQDCILRICDNDNVDERIRRKLYLKMLRYYYDADNMQALDACLDNIPKALSSPGERGEIFRYMVRRGRNEEAWEWVLELGPYFVEPKPLMRLVGEQIELMDGARDEMLLQVALYCFRYRKFDSRIVQYLAQWAQCPTKELRDIWKAARSLELDAGLLSERLLVQMLFSGAFVGERMDIFDYYVSWDADIRITEAFLDRCCYDYFVREQLMDVIVFRELGRLYETQRELQRVCKLAYLKYYAENTDQLQEKDIPVIEEFLEEFLAEKIHLNFFRNYIGLHFARESLLRELMDKTVVEYRAKSGSKANIHYVIMREDGGSSEYLTEPMREICSGVFFKEFVLFFGENLQYYIMEENGGEEQLTESGNLQKSDIRGDGVDWRYEMINDIIISKTLEDYDTLDGLLDEYYRREYLYQNLFALQ